MLRAIAAVANIAPRVQHRVNDYATVAATIAAGDAVGMLPRYTSRSVDDREIVRIPLLGVSTHRLIDVLARPETLRRRSVRLVVDGLERVMSRLSG